MKKVSIALALAAATSAAFGWDNKYEIQVDPYGTSAGGSREVEMRPRYDYDPSNRYRGEIDSDGSVRMKNYEGHTLRGTVENDGYGRLRDNDGNTYRVRPR